MIGAAFCFIMLTSVAHDRPVLVRTDQILYVEQNNGEDEKGNEVVETDIHFRYDGGGGQPDLLTVKERPDVILHSMEWGCKGSAQ
jgi:hypothetical protein